MDLEKDYWRQLVCDLQARGFTLEGIGQEMGLSERQVTNIKSGDRPKGWAAIRLFTFHMKHCPVMDDKVDRTAVPSLSAQKT